MFRYFVYRRHGAISVMLAFLLISVLSLSSTMMETARYRSMERLLNELEQNALFSLLGYYDSDLYKEFGLLAMEPDTGEEQLRQYLEQNLNGLGSGMSLNGLDKMLEIGGVEVDKIYELTQNEVFRAQVMEFAAYRAPVRLVSNMANLDELLEQLTKELESALPLFETMKKLADCMKNIIDTFKKLYALTKSAEDFQKKSEDYKTAVDKYNAAVSSRDSYKNDHDSSEEGYAETLAALNSAVASNASSLRGKISEAKEALADYYEKYTDFKGAYDSALSSEVDVLISAAKYDADAIEDENARKNTKKMLDDFGSGIDGARGLCNKVVSEMDTLYEEFILSCQDALTSQYNALGKDNPEELGSTGVVNTLSESSALIVAVRVVVGLVATLVEVVGKWNDSIAQISDVIKVMKIIATKGLFDPEYNNMIGYGVWNSLPGVSNGGRLKAINNPFASGDEKLVMDRLKETEKVAASLDYDMSFLEPGAGPVEEAALQTAMEEMKTAADAFQDKCESLSKASNILTILTTLFSVIGTLIKFLDRLINLIKVFISCIIDRFTRMLYPKLWGSVYANEMFSNRTTDVGEDKRLNGSDLPDFSSFGWNIDYECFDMANTEYILAGTQSEIANQVFSFTLILIMRILCNIPAILADSQLNQLVGELCAIPILGWIAAIIIVCMMLFIESWSDMIFMIYGSEGVDIIKTKGYFALDGSNMDELVDKVNDLLGSLAVKDDEDEDEGGLDIDEYLKGLLKWDYKDHMQLMLLLFVPNAKINARCADLIEMQMRQIKKKGGDLETFHLDKMATYARARVEAYYKPMLPIPTIPGLNDTGLRMEALHYSGY